MARKIRILIRAPRMNERGRLRLRLQVPSAPRVVPYRTRCVYQFVSIYVRVSVDS